MHYFTRRTLTSAIALATLSTGAHAQEATQLNKMVVSASGFEQALVDAPASSRLSLALNALR